MKTGSKLSEDEIQLYNAFVASKKAQPVAVDLASTSLPGMLHR